MTGLLREVPRQARDLTLYPRLRQSVATETGEVRTTGLLNVPKGPSLTLHEGGLLVERSLPKALRGQNIEDLTPEQVPEAIAAVDREVAELVPGLPSLAEWAPVRADYCESRRLGSEAVVMRELERLAGVVLPFKGLPVRGQHHSVRWPKGAVQPKAYSKFLESKGNALAAGVLRREASVYRLKTFRELTGLAEPRVVDVLTAECWARVWDPFERPLRGAAMSVRELSDVELGREMVKMFGVRRTAALLGYCWLFVLAGVRTRQDMLASEVLEWRTKYRVLSDLKAFRDAMLAKGLTFGEDDEDSEPSSPVQAAVRLAA